MKYGVKTADYARVRVDTHNRKHIPRRQGVTFVFFSLRAYKVHHFRSMTQPTYPIKAYGLFNWPIKPQSSGSSTRKNIQINI